MQRKLFAPPNPAEVLSFEDRLHVPVCQRPGVRLALQGMAGNIIHAIATTNAIVGGLIVIEALKLLAAKPQESKVDSPES